MADEPSPCFWMCGVAPSVAGRVAPEPKGKVTLRTFASIFTGGELAGIGAGQAGLTPIWGVEHDPDIAAVAEQNVNSKVIVSRAQDVDYSRLESPFWLHGSPQCINASQAKQGAGETEEDKSQARAYASALRALMPRRASLENVWNYRTFGSFQIICSELSRLGYQFRYWHLNAANYAVPQTRKRLILVASLDGAPHRPPATHTNKPSGGLFDSLPRWVGWYEAIEDLIPTLPESEFAEWQLKRLSGLSGNTLITEQYDLPSGNDGRAPVCLSSDIPASTVLANHAGKFRAFIIPGDNASNETVRRACEPMITIQGRSVGQCPHRAFLLMTGNTQIAHPTGTGIKLQDESANTVTRSLDARAWLSHGRVVSMTVRANARFQSIPDSYILPESNKLASRIVGNAVPPLLMQRIVEANL